MKCVTGSWDLIIPSDLLQEILSRLGLKDNIHASAVCKTWCEAAVSVRKLQPRPWLFYPQEGSEDREDYILSDPSRSQTYKLNFPELDQKFNRFAYSRDGWLLVIKDYPSVSLLLNPFTRERIYLPEGPSFSTGYYLAFSAAPTSTSCLVFSLNYTNFSSHIVISTWRPGLTVWTPHLFKKHLSGEIWNKCVYSNGMFYCLNTYGRLGVFDPSRETWNVLPVKPSPAVRSVFMMEHEGDIFCLCIRRNKNLAVFKLNFKRKLWEKKRELGGLTIFASYPGSFARAGLSAEERNRIYTSYPDDCGRYGTYHPLGHEKLSPSSTYLPTFTAWVDPPHNNINL